MCLTHCPMARRGLLNLDFPHSRGLLADTQAIPLCAAGMSQTWWKGWIARKIEGS